MEEAYAFIEKFLEEHPLEKIPLKDVLSLFRCIDTIIQGLDLKSPRERSFLTYTHITRVLSRLQVGQLWDLQGELSNRDLVEFDVDLMDHCMAIMQEALTLLPIELEE